MKEPHLHSTSLTLALQHLFSRGHWPPLTAKHRQRLGRPYNFDIAHISTRDVPSVVAAASVRRGAHTRTS